MDNDFVYLIPCCVLFYEETLVSCHAKLIYAYIASLVRSGGKCFATNEHLASKFKLSIRVVQRCLRQLENENLIEIINNYKYKSQRIITIKNSTGDDKNDTPG